MNPCFAAMGIDPSLRRTGVATARGPWTIRTSDDGPARLDHIRNGVVAQLDGIELVAIEGYAYGKEFSMAALGEVGGVIRHALWQANVAYIDIAPPTLKVYALGVGRGSKTDVVVAARDRLGYEGTDNDEADALWLYAMAADLLGQPIVDLPQSHRRALDRMRGSYP